MNNLQGPDLVRGLLKRHLRLTVRTVGLIKRNGAAVSQEDVNSFFDNYEKVATGVPAENVFNYDETNLQEKNSR